MLHDSIACICRHNGYTARGTLFCHDKGTLYKIIGVHILLHLRLLLLLRLLFSTLLLRLPLLLMVMDGGRSSVVFASEFRSEDPESDPLVEQGEK